MTGIVLVATGCAGPQLATSPLAYGDEAKARFAMKSEVLPPELDTRGREQVAMVRRVERRIRPATWAVCARTLDRETCRKQYRKITVLVKPEDDTFNATADIEGNVTFYGRLVRRMGSDDEVAGVTVREMAQVLLKHNEKARQNTAVGMLVGGLVTGALAVGAGPCYTARCTNARTELVGQGMGEGRRARALQPADGAGGGPARGRELDHAPGGTWLPEPGDGGAVQEVRPSRREGGYDFCRMKTSSRKTVICMSRLDGSA